MLGWQARDAIGVQVMFAANFRQFGGAGNLLLNLFYQSGHTLTIFVFAGMMRQADCQACLQALQHGSGSRVF